MERQPTNEQTYQAVGVDAETAAQAGAIADRQATDPSYNLSNADQIVLQTAYNQIFQRQLEEAQRERDDAEIKGKVREYVLLMDQAQETESIALIDAAVQIKRELVAEGRLSAAEFDKRVMAEDEQLWVQNYDDNEGDDNAFEARWRQETASLGTPGASQMDQDDQQIQIAEAELSAAREELLEVETDIEETRASRRSRSRSRQVDFDL